MWTRRGRSLEGIHLVTRTNDRFYAKYPQLSTQNKSVFQYPESRFSCKKNEKAANNNKHQRQQQKRLKS